MSADDVLFHDTLPGTGAVRSHASRSLAFSSTIPAHPNIPAYPKRCIGRHCTPQGVTLPLERSEHVDDDERSENAHREDQRYQCQAQFKGASTDRSCNVPPPETAQEEE